MGRSAKLVGHILSAIRGPLGQADEADKDKADETAPLALCSGVRVEAQT
jgi:hypothetical protein